MSLCEGLSGYMSKFGDSKILFICLCMSHRDRVETDMEMERKIKMVHPREYQHVTCCVVVGGSQYISVTKTCTCVRASERRALTVSGKMSVCAAKSKAT